MTINHRTGKPFPTGARPTPAHRLAHEILRGSLQVHAPKQRAAGQAAWLPKVMTMEGNDQYGDCVSAEEAFHVRAVTATILGQSAEADMDDADCIQWAAAHGVRDGADLLSVLQMMQTDGMPSSDGKKWRDGVPAVVDYTNESALQTAIDIGPVKLGIMSSALPSGAGNQNGWTAYTPGPQGSEDHCVSVPMYGSPQYVQQCMQSTYGVNVDVTNAPAMCYGLYTWSTIGIVSHDWIVAAASEAYSRNPPVVGLGPPTPPVPPPPTPPVPQPPTPAGGFTLQVPAMSLPIIPTASLDALPPWLIPLLRSLCQLLPPGK